MSDVAIRVEGLGKKYRLGAKQEPYYSLRDSIVGVARKPLQLARRIGNRASAKGAGRQEFWALKDVGFEVKQGAVLGIIGRNGAGKSTLLKILSEITEPTTGRITINGRVASLLEVGTGFHPELTGRENIYLNGAILGMSKVEIARKFDEIVAFAEVEQFIDTQVKHYSSGMYLRLAFAVAAHLEPEILIVDEVIAVGDIEFQRRCLRKMGDVASSGRTVLFVSHDLRAIESLCTSVSLLNAGTLLCTGNPHEMVHRYLECDENEIIKVDGKGLFWVGVDRSSWSEYITTGEDIVLPLIFRSGDSRIRRLHVDIAIHRDDHHWITHNQSKHVAHDIVVDPHREICVKFAIEKPNLAPGDYHATVYAHIDNDPLVWVERVKVCHVLSRGRSEPASYARMVRGVIAPPFSVEVIPVESHSA